MKFSLIAVCVVLALAHGSQAAEAPELEKYFEEMKTKLFSISQELSEKITAQVGQAQTYMQEGQTQLEPLAAQIQEQLKPLAANIEEHLKPLGENLQTQFQPLLDNFQLQMQEILRKLTEKAKAISN